VPAGQQTVGKPQRDPRSPRGRQPRRAGSVRNGMIQSSRMIRAAVEVVSERGYAGGSVSLIVEQARASRKTFYECFESYEDCFLAAFDECLEQMAEVARPLYHQGEGAWHQRVRTALEGVMELLERDPVIATLVFVEAPKAGPKVHERRTRVIKTLQAVVDEGRSPNLDGLPANLTAETIVSGAVNVVQTRLMRYEQVRMMQLVNPLMSVVVHPYLGPAAAADELARPTPRIRKRQRTAATGTVVSDLPPRLTYRTIRVLMVIGATPGACNRDIAQASGISYDGQISRLLSRLEALGLAMNADTRVPPANSWHLTAKGSKVERALMPNLHGNGAGLESESRTLRSR
jgi:AcrR family transcriptional regulator